MSKPLIYIDQNMIGFQLDGVVDLSRLKDVYWVYSKEHFAEIGRSESPEKYLGALGSIDAKLLDIKTEDFKLTGEASLVHVGTPEEHYASYLEAVGDVPFDDGIFDPLQAWGNGGGNAEILRALPEKYSAQLKALNDLIPMELQRSPEVSPNFDFSEMIEQMISGGNDIERTRTILGGGKGRFGSIEGDNQLLQIWEIIGPMCSPVTSEQFFGFEPFHSFGYEKAPLYLGIASCCAVLDVLGFYAEKKARRPERLANVRSDASHIGMAAYCSALLTADRRLAKRAKAIYQYKKIGTITLILEVAG